MPISGGLFSGRSMAIAALCAVLLRALVANAADTAGPTATPETTDAADSSKLKELTTLRTLRRIEEEQGALARDLIAPLHQLGLQYAATDRCPDAITVLDHTIEISRQLDGVLNRGQLQFLQPLLDCHLALDQEDDFERTLRHALLIDEADYGKNDPRLLPALQRAAGWYERAGWYDSARRLYTRAIKLVRKLDAEKVNDNSNANSNDLLLIAPLRGIARTCRLEYQYRTSDEPLNSAGRRSLERAVDILRAHPEVHSDTQVAQRIDTLLDLGDWYQMIGAHRDALRLYKEAWQVENGSFNEPVRILLGVEGGKVLRRPPPHEGRYRRYSVDLAFTVTREGRVTHVTVTESNAPSHLHYRVIEGLLLTRYRPRFDHGEPVDTPGMHYTEGVYVSR